MIEDGYQKNYRLRYAIPGVRTLEVTFPYEVADREARSRGITVTELLKQVELVAVFNGFDGVLYKFAERTTG